MSLQVCSCGWSKVTTYQGLRIHQGKKGCTPKGTRILEGDQFRNSFSLKSNITIPPINVMEPFLNVFTPYFERDAEWSCWKGQGEESRQMDRRQICGPPVKKEGGQLVRVLLMTTSREAEIQAKEKERKEEREEEERREVLKVRQELQQQQQLVQELQQQHHQLQQQQQQQQHQLMQQQQQYQLQQQQQQQQQQQHQLQQQQQQHQLQQQQQLMQQQQSVSPQLQLPLNQPHMRKEGFQLVSGLPTTTTQEAEIRAKEKEREEERERERREAQKLLKLRQDRITADLKQEIQTREQKMADVTSSAKAMKASLDTEWLEINKVFSEVMKVVKDTLSEALQPLEKRRDRVKRDAQDLNRKLQKEIDELKKTMDELDKKTDLQASYQTSLDGSQVWKNVNIDCSFSLGSLRSKTSHMMEQIHQKVEKLSSVELKRIASFAVDVKLDPATAHQCLVLSSDGKTVKYGGQDQNVPDSLERFDIHASIMGVNMLTSGKSYWEVEVGNKTGWDLGVARRDANRKGKLSVTPDEGYWVIVHYEEEKYAALTAPSVSLTLTVKPQKVGVFVDYEEGLVSFYNVTAQSHIFSFTECSFCDELLPYFSPHLKHNRKNSDPLVLTPVRKKK